MKNEKTTKGIVNKARGPIKVNTEHCNRLRKRLAEAREKAKNATTAERRKAFVEQAKLLEKQLREDGCNNNAFKRSGGDGVVMKKMDI
jgi:hypothetical protein